ncbi:MAG: L-glutamate gamma-semialdehyde dehydrogenase, partial [Pseudomonadota bacterium]
LGGYLWQGHFAGSDALTANASTWGLMFTGQNIKLGSDSSSDGLGALRSLVARSGETVMRQAVRQAVQILGHQFVLADTIDAALVRARPYEKKGYLFSYDLLGEDAQTEQSAQAYFERYLDAIEKIGAAAGPMDNAHRQFLMRRPGVSIKLSALVARFEPGRDADVAQILLPRLQALAAAARRLDVPVTIDMEEQDRLEPTLEVFAKVYKSDDMAHWHGLGIAVQAYSKRAIAVLRWLRQLALSGGRRIPVRLVKGAYWDHEIKAAQHKGLADYPVFTRKVLTDVSYLACARLVLSDREAFFPQFATHNAHAIAAAHAAAAGAACEFQRLHGMGEALHAALMAEHPDRVSCRIYAPVGGQTDLLAYLLRRLLENTANTSFLQRMGDEAIPVDDMVADPVQQAEALLQSEEAGAVSDGAPTDHLPIKEPVADERTSEDVIKAPLRALPLPRDLYGAGRRASAGLALSQRHVRMTFQRQIEANLSAPFEVAPIINGEPALSGVATPDAMFCPHDVYADLGLIHSASSDQIDEAIAAACQGFADWSRVDVSERARIIEVAADGLERDRARLMAVLVREAGLTIAAAHDEVREAVDLLRYYAQQGRAVFGEVTALPGGPLGQINRYSCVPRGPIAIISPFSSSLANSIGQATAALVAGNSVLIKPAPQTPIMGQLVVLALINAGVLPGAVHLLPGDGEVGRRLVRDQRIAGVAFTGAMETAWSIQSDLAARRSAHIPFVAHTGGLNAMIADSTALPEQVVRHCIHSAFYGAGQRCGAARALIVQDDIAPVVIEMLTGTIEALKVGDPLDFDVDVGPLIDTAAQDAIEAHKMQMRRVGQMLIDRPVPEAARVGTYVTPAAVRLHSPDAIGKAPFGPVLHVITYQRGAMSTVIDQLNAMGIGLTLGLHTQLQSVVDDVTARTRAGLVFVNRDQLGTVAGLQPFGGQGLAGAGPKLGGPDTLKAFASERVLAADLTATAGLAQ